MQSEQTDVSLDTHVINYAFEYPLTDRDGLIETIAIILGLGFLSFFIIPGFILHGYILRVREAAAKNEPTLPALDLNEWDDLLKEGVLGWLSMLPLAILTLAIALPLIYFHEALVLIPFLGLAYISPAYLTVYSVDRDIPALYTTTDALEFAFTKTYVIGSLWYILLGAIGFVLVLISMFTFGLAFVLVYPFFTLAVPSFWGHVYAQAYPDTTQ